LVLSYQSLTPWIIISVASERISVIIQLAHFSAIIWCILIEAFVSLDTLLSIPYSLPYFILLLRVSFTYRHVSVIATAGYLLSWYYHPLRDSFLTLATAQICHAFFSSLSSVYATSSDVLSFVYASARLVLFFSVMLCNFTYRLSLYWPAFSVSSFMFVFLFLLFLYLYWLASSCSFLLACLHFVYLFILFHFLFPSL